MFSSLMQVKPDDFRDLIQQGSRTLGSLLRDMRHVCLCWFHFLGPLTVEELTQANLFLCQVKGIAFGGDLCFVIRVRAVCCLGEVFPVDDACHGVNFMFVEDLSCVVFEGKSFDRVFAALEEMGFGFRVSGAAQSFVSWDGVLVVEGCLQWETVVCEVLGRMLRAPLHGVNGGSMAVPVDVITLVTSPGVFLVVAFSVGNGCSCHVELNFCVMDNGSVLDVQHGLGGRVWEEGGLIWKGWCSCGFLVGAHVECLLPGEGDPVLVFASFCMVCGDVKSEVGQAFMNLKVHITVHAKGVGLCAGLSGESVDKGSVFSKMEEGRGTWGDVVTFAVVTEEGDGREEAFAFRVE